MASLRIKNFPDVLHQRLRDYAQESQRTIRDIVLEALEREIERLEARKRFAQRIAADSGDFYPEDRPFRDNRG